MRYLILSDIHANLEAFDAVLAAASDSWDRILCLGDLVGYGPDPNAVIERLRALDPLAVIRGNHDKAACGIDDAANFNQIARYAAEWTAGRLTAENREYLRDLPIGPVAIDDVVEICHGAPFDEDHYIFDGHDARRALDVARRPLCLFGHTHLPVVFVQQGEDFDGVIPEEEDARVPIRPDVRYLINAGSVGQPRDGDPRAAYGLFESEGPTLRLRRVGYPVQQVQQKIIAAGLPQSLAHRLAVGR